MRTGQRQCRLSLPTPNPTYCGRHLRLLRLDGPGRPWHLFDTRMRLHHVVLSHPRLWLGWANFTVFSQPRHWPEPLPDFGLGWATPDKRRFPNTPFPDATKAYDSQTTSPFATSTDGPCLSYAIHDQHEIPRSDGARHTRSRAATLAGNTPLRPDYRRAARSGFAASAAPAPRPKTSFRSSPPPRSVRLGSTIPLGRLTSPHPPPGPNSQMGNPTTTTSPIEQHPTPGNDILAAADQLSNALLSYSHGDWDQAQRVDPLCDATRRYIKLGSPNPPPLSLCDHLPSHTRPEIADIIDLASKGRLLRGDDDTTLLVRKPITDASAPDGHSGRRVRQPFDDPIRIYVPLLARPWIMHACHADVSCHFGVTRTLKMLERFYFWVGMEACTKWWVRRCLECQARKTSCQTIRWPTLSIPLPNSPGISVSVDFFGPLPITAR